LRGGACRCGKYKNKHKNRQNQLIYAAHEIGPSTIEGRNLAKFVRQSLHRRLVKLWPQHVYRGGAFDSASAREQPKFFLVAVLNSQLFQSTLTQQDHCQQPTDGYSIGPVIAREPIKNFLNSLVVNHNATLAIGRWHDGLPKANHALGTRAIKPCGDRKIKALKSVSGIFTDGGHAGSTG